MTYADCLAAMKRDPDDKRHGTDYGYRLGCRCERCREARREALAYQQAQRAARHDRIKAELEADDGDLRHGLKGYRCGCRCQTCRDAAYADRVAKYAAADSVKRRAASARTEARRQEWEQQPKPKRNSVLAAKRKEIAAQRKRTEAKDVCTVNDLLRPMMGKPSIEMEPPRCAVCGKTWPLNRHHIVPRSAGKWVRNGQEVAKPTVMLCGSGNASGCHGRVHRGELHFRWREAEQPTAGEAYDYVPAGAGHWEVLETDRAVKYETALKMEGWRKL